MWFPFMWETWVGPVWCSTGLIREMQPQPGNQREGCHPTVGKKYDGTNSKSINRTGHSSQNESIGQLFPMDAANEVQSLEPIEVEDNGCRSQHSEPSNEEVAEHLRN